MTIKSEVRIRDFEFWMGAADVARKLTNEEWDTIEAALEELYPDGLAEDDLNDLFWFHADEVFGMCGLDITEEEVLERADE
jgi:hypothetical protein